MRCCRFATETLKPLPHRRYIPIQLILWEYDPWALKCFTFASLDQQELFSVTSNALFCLLDVWLDFIRVVVLPTLSLGINFHCNKQIRNYTPDGLVNFRFNRRGLNEAASLTLCIGADS